MRYIQLPKRTLAEVNHYSPLRVAGDILRHKPSLKSPNAKRYNQSYRLPQTLFQYSDSQLQTLIQVMYDPQSNEAVYRDFLYHSIPSAKREVHCEAGIIDVMTNESVIEVKKAKNWKHSLGQALSYSYCTGKKPAVALIGQIPEIAFDVMKKHSVSIIDLGVFHSV